MNFNLQSFLEFPKILFEHNESEIRVERKFLEENYTETKASSYAVQLGSSTLILSKTNNFPCSETEDQEFFNQLNEFDRQKKFYYQILDKKEPLSSSEGEILVGVECEWKPKSGPGPRAKADALKNVRKTGGGSIFVQGFTPQRQYGSHSINKPLSCRNNVKLNQEHFNGNQNPGGSSSSMETMSKRLSQEYKEYQQKFNSPSLSQRFDTKQYDQEKFKELAKDPKAKNEIFHKKTVDEARTAIHAEIEGLVDNVQRIEQPNCKSVDLDFKVDGPAPYTHMDVKHPVGNEILRKQNQTIDIKTMAYRMGNEIIDQKERFCDLEQGPESSKNVLHIVDLAYVPSHEKEIVKEYCLKGAEDAGISEGIQFLNDNK